MRLLLSLFFLICSIFSSPLNAVETPPTTEYDDWKTEPLSPETTDDGHFAAAFVKMIVLLSISLLFILLIAWLAKRFFQGKLLESNRTSRIQILEKRILSPKSSLYLIAIDDHHLLISEHANGIQKLVEISGNRFSDKLK